MVVTDNFEEYSTLYNLSFLSEIIIAFYHIFYPNDKVRNIKQDFKDQLE